MYLHLLRDLSDLLGSALEGCHCAPGEDLSLATQGASEAVVHPSGCLTDFPWDPRGDDGRDSRAADAPATAEDRCGEADTGGAREDAESNNGAYPPPP